MITACVILVGLIAVLSIVGGIAMMIDANGKCFFSWYMGWNAFTSGVQIVGLILPATVEAVLTAITSNN